jgi:AcrR family transcriptional regulator
VTRSGTTADVIRGAALDLFERDGYDAATMRGLADAVGIKAASLYNHFRSKEDILWDLIQRAFAELEQGRMASMEGLGPSKDDPRAQLDAFYRAHIRFHAVNRASAEVINRQFRSLSPARFASSIALRDQYQRHLQGILLDGVSCGAFAVPDVRVATFSLLEMGMAVATWYRPDGALGLDEMCDIYAHLAAKLVAP